MSVYKFISHLQKIAKRTSPEAGTIGAARSFVFSKRLPPIKVRFDVHQNAWVLLEPVDMEVPKAGGVETLTIPEGFTFDNASVPRFAWPIIGPMELGAAAPLVHDYLYRKKGVTLVGFFNRLEADKIFLSLMKSEGVKFWRRALGYWSVRAFWVIMTRSRKAWPKRSTSLKSLAGR